MKVANYSVVEQGPEYVIIEDLGPWDKFPTITNAAEEVVESIFGTLKGRRLFYYDSEGRLDEIKVKDNKFAGFAPGCPFKEK